MTFTLSEVLELTNDWEGFCEHVGYSPYVVSEGGGHIEVGLTVEEARQFGIVRNDDE